jgi:two-component system chemotaxis response regulator CheY
MAYNILVVDDSKTIRSIIVRILKLTKLELGQILEANNGEEALDCLKNNWIDLILSDLNMPVMNGIEMIAALAKNSLLKDIPVVIISTDGSARRMEELKEKGIREYITKPFTPEAMSKVIDRVLGVHHE